MKPMLIRLRCWVTEMWRWQRKASESDRPCWARLLLVAQGTCCSRDMTPRYASSLNRALVGLALAVRRGREDVVATLLCARAAVLEPCSEGRKSSTLVEITMNYMAGANRNTFSYS